MSRITVPARESAPEASKPMLDAVEKQLGVVPNLFRLVALSPAALQGFLGMNGALAKTLDLKTRERIALAVAQINGCNYKYSEMFGCSVLFSQSENQLRFDAAWLDRTPKLGNEITYSTVVELCDRLMEDLQLRLGLAGKVRQLLLTNLLRPLSFSDVASNLNMSARTLRRKLREEKTSFRNLVDELRMEMAIRYLRETDLTVEHISESLSFSDVANFRQAFRRWTKAAPHKFRKMSGETSVSA